MGDPSSPAGPPKLVLASGNAGKLREMRALLDGLVLETLGLRDLDEPVELPPEGVDYSHNAVVKAATVARATGLAALADDSGLEVAALGGRPGPLSARFGGPGLDDAGRVQALLRELADTTDRRARFVCFVALVLPSGVTEVRRGECGGAILREPTGAGGFGYDPIFEVEGHGRAMAELAESEKNAISHRARALAALRPTIERELGVGSAG